MSMNRRAGLIGLALAGGLVVGLVPAVSAAPLAAPAAPSTTKPVDRPSDVPAALAGKLDLKRQALRQTALTDVLDGTAVVERKGGSDVVKVGEEQAAARPPSAGEVGGNPDDGAQDQYVELSREGTDRIFVILAEFGDQRDPRYPDKDIDPSTPGPVTWDGPLHNQIPEPGPDDNSTNWQPDYDQQHYQDLYFGEDATDGGRESVRQYYETQSSGRYSISGEVTDWVKVPYNEARYGRSTDPNQGGPGDDPNVCGDVVCNNVQALIVDGIAAWEQGQRAAGRTEAQIAEELKTFDVQDRYDFDGDGNFAEPDGYLDHFQIVHAGGDESDGDPQQGEDAIWAHRSYVYAGDQGRTGPDFNQLGGAQIGATGLWVGDYTMQPENGGMSVFAHEYGHDLGLPDHYDTAGGDNSVQYWNLMAQSRVNAEGEPLGTRAADLSAWDKLQLGWLDVEVAQAGDSTTIDLGPHEYNTAKPQAVAVVLPEKEVTTPLGAPYAGDWQYWSGSGDDLSTTLTAPIDLRGACCTASISWQARYDIEADYDYLYVQASTDGGKNWDFLDGTVGGEPFGEDASGNPAISGTQQDWAQVDVSLNSYVRKNTQFRLLYRTDGGVAPIGFFADNFVVTAKIVRGRDGAETANSNMIKLDGFTRQQESFTQDYDNYYLASNRSAVAQDTYLQTGPYNFGFGPERPDFVEHFAYEQGLLVSYWDTSVGDNNTSEHPGSGLILPIDAHPVPMLNDLGNPWRSRIQVFDAPFSLTAPTPFTLHRQGVPTTVGDGLSAAPVFDDTGKYFYDELPLTGVKLPAVGVKMAVTAQDGTSMTVAIS